MKIKNIPQRISFTQKDPINILERFYSYLPAWPHCLSGLDQPSCQLSKDRAIFYPYIQLNKLRRAYICLDIDRPGAKFAHDEVGISAPTFILVNPDNGHAHIFYELRHPVPFTGNSRKKPQQYFNAVRKALSVKFQADLSFSANMVKNPFHNTQRGGKWEPFFNYVTYNLKTLASFIDLKTYQKTLHINSRWQNFDKPIIEGMRNVTVFEIVRKYSYTEIKNHEEYETFCDVMNKFSSSLNNRCCKPPLPRSELDYIVSRVCEWSWSNRKEIRNYSNRKHGIMCFEPIPADLESSKREVEITMRKRSGAKYTHKERRRKTEQKIVNAIDQLKTQNLKITKAAVARLSGVSRENISKRYKHLFEK